MKDTDLILIHLYHLAHVHEEQHALEVDEVRQGYLVGVAKGLLLSIEVIKAVTDIELEFVDPYLKEKLPNENT